MKFEKISYNDSGLIPTRADDRSAGHDFYASEEFTINPGEVVKVHTLIKAEMPSNVVLLLFVRSSVGIKRNIMLANGTGVIDASYYNNPDNEGDIICALYNYGKEPQRFEKGERIVQGIFVEYYPVDNSPVLNKERTGGIGSSGK